MAVVWLQNNNPDSRLNKEELKVLDSKYKIFGIEENDKGLVEVFGIEPKEISDEVKEKVNALLSRRQIEPRGREYVFSTRFMLHVYRAKDGSYYYEYGSYSTMLNNWVRNTFEDIASLLKMEITKSS